MKTPRKKVLIVFDGTKKPKNVNRDEYNWLDETDFLDEYGKKLLSENNLILIKKP